MAKLIFFCSYARLFLQRTSNHVWQWASWKQCSGATTVPNTRTAYNQSIEDVILYSSQEPIVSLTRCIKIRSINANHNNHNTYSHRKVWKRVSYLKAHWLLQDDKYVILKVEWKNIFNFNGYLRERPKHREVKNRLL
jgi:hypothetical protein